MQDIKLVPFDSSELLSVSSSLSGLTEILGNGDTDDEVVGASEGTNEEDCVGVGDGETFSDGEGDKLGVANDVVPEAELTNASRLPTRAEAAVLWD